MKRVITFTEEQVMQIQYMLNAVTVTGIQNAKQVAAIAQMLELGMPEEINESAESEKFKDVYSPVDWENPPERKTTISNEKKKEGAS
ncbi:hypothetical protein [Lacrimispora celerecrescens]|nr:hypothetical protein [Lacrimispora celerecrescens]